MCGIFGLVFNRPGISSTGEFEEALHLLFELSEPRGREAAGLAIASKKQISIYKQAVKPIVMLKDPEFTAFLSSCLSTAPGSNHLTTPVAAIGHCRLVTNGSQVFSENNQPISINHMVGIHNGIIVNEQSLRSLYSRAFASSSPGSGSDSEVLFGLIGAQYEKEGDLVKALAKAYLEIIGSASVAMFADNMPGLTLATNTGSLYYSWNTEHGLFVFASERYMLEQFLLRSSLTRGWNREEVKKLDPVTCAIVPFDRVLPAVWSLAVNASERGSTDKLKAEQYAIETPSSAIRLLRRCTRCVLPVTYPFITLDDAGVCNYCRNYKNQEPLGREALEEVLKKHRSKNGAPDCIVGFSGGRDSSYGLHLLKTEFGMHPIAYTYDWGMVTDQARRNQSRICGKLGIEHIIRAADIPTKRRYIRKNIHAWLKKPELGMVPIFMAGDKLFYHYGRKLRNETGIRFTIFCAGQQVEQMEFKVGFCGVNQDMTNNTRLYHYDPMVKVRLALWYSKQYLLNPSYINESLIDSVIAFYSSFLDKDDFLYLYYYIPWDEAVIERTLKEEYDWEADEQYGTNQWRMGDGHTAFIDYIYYTVAGFSEFDVFRSHQIREGCLTREKALELIEEDNKPRIGTLRDFSNLVGFNLEEVLMKINAIPKLYAYR